MKILMVTPYFWPKIGGLERYAYETAERLVQRGHEVHVITSASVAGTGRVGNLVVHYVAASFVVSNTPANPAWLWQVRRLISNIKPDVINVHAPVPSLALVAGLVAGRIPLVTTYHAGSMKKGQPLIDAVIAVYEKGLLPALMHRSQLVIAASDFVADGFLHTWKDKLTVITPGVDTKAFAPGYAKRARGRVLFIGDFRDPRKGLPYLLEAMAALPIAHLRVVGAGEPDAAQARVTYLGELRGAALMHELQSAELLVLPSVSDAESFGMVLIEAMASGLPVIGTTAGGMSYVIRDGENGLLVPPADSLALRGAIARLLGSETDRKQMGDQGRAEAVGQYDWDKRGLETELALLQAINMRAGQPAEVKRG